MPDSSPCFVDCGGKRVAFEVHNPGHPPFVLVPGIGESRSSYRHLVPLLTAAGFTVYSMDLRGHGSSDVDFASYAAHDIGADIVALLQSEGLTDAILVGNSISGGSVAWAAAEAPTLVAGIALLNPFVRDMPADRWMRPLVPLLFTALWGTWIWGQYRETLFISPPGDHAVEEPRVLAMTREPGRMAALGAMMRASKAPVAARLAEVRAPALVVMGDKDPDYTDPRLEGETVAGLLGGPATVQVVEATGHYPQAEHPQATAELLLSFAQRGVHAA